MDTVYNNHPTFPMSTHGIGRLFHAVVVVVVVVVAAAAAAAAAAVVFG